MQKQITHSLPCTLNSSQLNVLTKGCSSEQMFANIGEVIQHKLLPARTVNRKPRGFVQDMAVVNEEGTGWLDDMELK